MGIWKTKKNRKKIWDQTGIRTRDLAIIINLSREILPVQPKSFSLPWKKTVYIFLLIRLLRAYKKTHKAAIFTDNKEKADLSNRCEKNKIDA